jgi:hypothetical protein
VTSLSRRDTTARASRLFREGWRRVPGNDGLTRVAVPMSAIVPREPGSDVEHRGSHDGQHHGGAAFTAALDALKEAHASHTSALDNIIQAQVSLSSLLRSAPARLRARLARWSGLLNPYPASCRHGCTASASRDITT